MSFTAVVAVVAACDVSYAKDRIRVYSLIDDIVRNELLRHLHGLISVAGAEVLLEPRGGLAPEEAVGIRHGLHDSGLELHGRAHLQTNLLAEGGNILRCSRSATFTTTGHKLGE